MRPLNILLIAIVAGAGCYCRQPWRVEDPAVGFWLLLGGLEDCDEQSREEEGEEPQNAMSCQKLPYLFWFSRQKAEKLIRRMETCAP